MVEIGLARPDVFLKKFEKEMILMNLCYSKLSDLTLSKMCLSLLSPYRN